jgi:hypothetical protein
MNVPLHLLVGLVLGSPLAAPGPVQHLAVLRAAPAVAPAEEDRRQDFDYSIGTWHTRVSLLREPLSGSSAWAEYEGTSVVRTVGNGPANLVELEVEGPAGRIEGLSLRLYNPNSRQWSLNYSNSRSGTLTPPVYGGFRDGRGEFFGVDTLDGRAVLVRFEISQVTPGSWRYEQAFSDDAGKTWEVNWIAIDTRIDEAADEG